MKITEYWPIHRAAAEQIIGPGPLFTRTYMPESGHLWSTVKAPPHGYNVLRVDFDDETPEEREQIMQNLLLVAELKREQLLNS